MAVIDTTTWQTITGRTLSGSDLTACSAWCQAISTALTRLLFPLQLEPATRVDILDAPGDRDLLVRYRPVRQIIRLQFNPYADGVASRFTPDTELVEGQDYELLRDDPSGISLCGIIRRLKGAVWGVYRERLGPATLGFQFRPLRGAIRLEAETGFPQVPEDIRAAAALAVSLALQRRWLGLPTQSESWNGYSVSWHLPQAFALLHSDDVLALLRPYLPARFA